MADLGAFSFFDMQTKQYRTIESVIVTVIISTVLIILIKARLRSKLLKRLELIEGKDSNFVVDSVALTADFRSLI